MPKQTITIEIEGMTTDTYDKVDATITFVCEGRRNVANAQNMGKAADGAAWLFRKLYEASYLKPEEHVAEVAAIKEATKSHYSEELRNPARPNGPAQPKPNIDTLVQYGQRVDAPEQGKFPS